MLGCFLIALSSAIEEYTGDKSDFNVGYYTMIKLVHHRSLKFLSSLGLNYLNGSNQQVVRGMTQGVLAEAYWTVFPASDDGSIKQGETVQCGDIVRFQHAVTQRWLHSHNITSMSGAGNEVSCFDDNDSGNLWIVECESTWDATTPVLLMHKDTRSYLTVNTEFEYPIEQGEGSEVFCDPIADDAQWSVSGGILVADEDL